MEEDYTRISWPLGRRIERLLLVGIALVALALAAFYLAFAARHYTEDRLSQGMENLALLIEGDDKVLQRFYELEAQRRKLAQQKKKDAPTENFYVKALEDKVARAATLSGVEPGALTALLDPETPPAEIVKALRERKRAMDERPATVAGVVVPSSTLGTRLPAAFVANVFIITLAPLIILWLGALQVTRRQERAALDSAVLLPYPHALNAANLPFEAALERWWPPLAADPLRAALLAFFRMALIAMLVVPMIAAYIATVTTLGMGNEGSWLRSLYAIVVILIMVLQAASLFIGEAPPALSREPEDEAGYDD